MKTDTEKVLKEMFDIDIQSLSQKAQAGLDDVENNHNMSWVKDIYYENKNKLDNNAIFYRGNKITYKTLFENSEIYASIFQNIGLSKNSEIPICMSNCPEFLYVIMGLNLIGAKANCFGDFDPNYLTEIINGCNSSIIICTDDQYCKIKNSIDNSNIKQLILFSLTDSLKNGIDPYIELDTNFYDFKNKIPEYKKSNSKIIDKNQFLKFVPQKVKKISDYDIGNINTEFLVTYSSGSTNANRPKAIIHTNRSLITIGRFQNPDLSGLPKMNDLIGEAIIPNHSNTGIISSISDVLYKGCTVALEPIYKKEFFLYSLAINKPNYVSAPRNMIVYSAKQLYANPKFKNFKMPYMMMLTSVGEPTSKGEEKFINKMLRKTKCGSDKLPRPISPVPLSIGGGDCERGGMFFTPYRSYQDLNPKFKLYGMRCGLKPYSMIQMAIIDQKGEHLNPGDFGRLVVKTPTTMKKYKNNEIATNAFYIKDSSGNVWTDCNVYASIDKYGTVEILDRYGKDIELSSGEKIPLFLIGKEVELDTKHILSYEIVKVDNNIVIHIEFQPNMKNNKLKALIGIKERILKKYGKNILNNIFFRIRSFNEGFVGTSCEKRNYNALVNEGISEKCIKLTELKNNTKDVSNIRTLKFKK